MIISFAGLPRNYLVWIEIICLLVDSSGRPQEGAYKLNHTYCHFNIL